MPDDCTGLPLAPHPGSFGFRRKNHTHEGVDFYVPVGTLVTAVEDGVVVAIEAFTGPHAGSPWWHDTWAVLVEGKTGVVNYGEIEPLVAVGQTLTAGDPVGRVLQVLTRDKGRPMSMLHLELYRAGTRAAVEWEPNGEKPDGLEDPTLHLLGISSLP